MQLIFGSLGFAPPREGLFYLMMTSYNLYRMFFVSALGEIK